MSDNFDQNNDLEKLNEEQDEVEEDDVEMEVEMGNNDDFNHDENDFNDEMINDMEDIENFKQSINNKSDDKIDHSQYNYLDSLYKNYKQQVQVKENLDNLVPNFNSNDNSKPLNEEKIYQEKLSKTNNINTFRKSENTLAKNFEIENNLISSNNQNTNLQLQNKKSNSRPRIEYDLYQDAIKRKEKLEKLDYNNMMEILINSSKHKISTKSYQISLQKIEKSIDQAFEKIIKTSEINFFQLGEILTILGVLRETFDLQEKQKDPKKIQNVKEIEIELKKNRKSDQRKKQEIQFLEQLWMILNPENAKMKANTTKEFLKILFSPINANAKEVADILFKFLQASLFLNTSGQSDQIISPLSLKQIDESELWSLEMLVKEFFQLKDNLLAYKGIGNIKPNSAIEIQNSHKKLTFKPQVNTKNTKIDQDFDKRNEIFLKNKKENIDKKQREMENSKSRECTFKPELYTKKKSDVSSVNTDNCYDRLYSTHQKKMDDIKEIKKKADEEKVSRELSGCTFKPQLNNFNKEVFESKLNEKEAKIYEQTIERMRNGILENFKKKYLSEK